MNISDEQYEEMQSRIDEVSKLLAFLLFGKAITISQEDFSKFLSVYSDFSVCVTRTENYIQMWLGKNEQ